MEQPAEVALLGLVTALVMGFVLARSAWFRGKLGELRVRATIRLRLPRRQYRTLHNLTLPTLDGTTQIDHVVVSRFGVFVIETKNLKGWIFGDASSKKWTQSIFGRSYPFQNPLHQNYRHVKAVEAAVELHPRCLHSVVVFVGRSRFKTDVPENVVRRRRLIRHIRSKSEVVLSEEQVEASLQRLEAARISGLGAAREHRRNLRQNQREPTCPRCGSSMVLRVAKTGRNTGSEFWGCSSFPRCTATRNAT